MGTSAPDWAGQQTVTAATQMSPASVTDASPARTELAVPAPAATGRRRTGLWQNPAAAALAQRLNSAAVHTPVASAPSLQTRVPEGAVQTAPTPAPAETVAPAGAAPRRRVALGQTAPAEAAVSAATAAPPTASPAPASTAQAIATAGTEARAPGAGSAVSSPAPPPATPAKPWYRTMGGIVGGVIALLIVAAAIVLAVRWFIFDSSAGAAFVAAFPGRTGLPDWAPVGQPLWTQWQHWLNAFFIILIIKTGWTVRTQKKSSASWQPRSGGKKITIELFTHLTFDVLWLANGVIFWVLLFATGQFIRIVPYSWAIFPNALSSALQYISLSWPTEDGWVNYNSLQVLTYFVTVFLAAPLATITGFRMSPMWPAKAEWLSKLYPVELARKIHFPVMVYFVLFVIVHVVLVLSTGALRNLNHMFWGSDDPGSWAGLIMFLIGIAAIVAAWFVLKPIVMQQIGGVFGKVGR